MITTNLRKVGGSVMLAVPPAMLKQLNLESGATVGLAVDGGRLVIEPRQRTRYTLDELLQQCDSGVPAAEEDQVWLDLAPAGGEI